MRNLYDTYEERRSALVRLINDVAKSTGGTGKVTVSRLLDPIRKFASEEEAPKNKRYWCEAANFLQIATAFGLTIDENAVGELEAAVDYATVGRVGRRIIGQRGLTIHREVGTQAVFTATDRFEEHDKRLLPVEKDALEGLVAAINATKGRLFNISARINSGLSSLLWEIHKVTQFKFQRVLHIRPGPGATEFDVLLKAALAEAKLGWPIVDEAPPEKGLDAIVAALDGAHALLVVHNIHFWYDIPASPGRRIVDLEAARRMSLERFELFAERFRKSSSRESALLVTSAEDFAPKPVVLLNQGFHKLSVHSRVDVNDRPETTLNSLIESFRRILYGERTASSLLDDCEYYEAEPPEGPRMRRFRTHLHRLRENNRTGIPVSTLRLRAAGFADPSARSEADPTQGYSFLVPKALVKELPVFSLMADDIRTVLACLEHTELTALRMISTGVYWFSQRMCEHVCATLKRLEADQSLARDLQARIPSWGDLKQLHSNRPTLVYPYFNHRSHLTGPLAVMAVVQEDWATFGPQSRSIVHGIIARRLAAAADDVPTTSARTLLKDEYPFALPRDGAAVVLRSEALRHFVRAAQLEDSDKDMILAAQTQFRKLDEAMPIETPVSDNDVPSQPMRNVLSRGGGRYLLKLEILHHLSSDGRGIQPHDHLDDDIKARYHSEVGIVDLALLRMSAANTALSKAKSAAEIGSRHWYDSSLHLAATYVLSSKWSDAERVLDEVDETIKNGSPDAGVSARASIQRAALALARGRIPEALECVQRVLLTDLGNLPVGDEALTVIDVLLAAVNANTSALTMALILVEVGTDELRSKNFPHEIMRFEIRRARCMTALGQPYAAERILDQVSFEFSKHGGSPRALHDFQIAGGECLLKLGWPEWALSGYLIPSLQRAVGTKTFANARQAAELAHVALDQVESRLDAESGAAQVDDTADRMKMARAFVRIVSVDQLPVVQEWQRRSGERSAKLWEQLDPMAKDNPFAPDPFYTNDLSVFKDVRETGAGDLVDPDFRSVLRVEIESALDANWYPDG